jgi:uncharacterized protein YhaN
MIFNRIHIDGFGTWRDLDLEELDPGLNVLLAPNEGGKTTLMTFIRSVLFGFRRRSDPQRYEPLRGGKHGGHIDFEAEGDYYRVARSADGTSPGSMHISDKDGSSLPEGKLADLLRNTTDVLFENVFAFGLTELQRLDTLQKEEVAGHIYSAGMASGGQDPIGFRQWLRKERDRLYLPRGRKQAVAEKLLEIGALQKEIDPLQQLPEEHATLLQQGRSLGERLAEVDLIIAARQSQLDAARRAQRAWRDYEDLLAAESALKALGVPLTAAGGEPAKTKTNAGDGQESVASPGTRPNPETSDPAELLPPSQRALLRESGRIRTLLAAAPRLRELRAAIQKGLTDADTANVALQTHLKDLGKGWNAERIRTRATGLKEREKIRQFAEEMRQVESEIESISGRAAEAHDGYETIVARRDPVSREAVMLTWALAVALTFISAVVVPPVARLVTTSAVGTIGAMTGIIMMWLRHRGRQQMRNERLAAADRETTMWAQHEDAQQSLREIEDKWQAWLKSQGLDVDLGADGALDLLDRIREAQEQDRRHGESSANAAKATSELTVACGRVNALFESLHRDQISLQVGLQEAVEPLLGELEALQAELEAAEDQGMRLRTVVDQYAQARAALRAVAGEEGPEALRTRLESLDPDQIERQVQDAEGEVAAASAQRDGLNEQLGGVRERLAHLEGDAELSDLLQAREEKRSELTGYLEEWAVHTVAGVLFDLAKQVYEEQRQPEVLKLAGRYFEAMTNGRYSRVLAPLGETRLEVEEKKGGRRKGPEALSRGTSEQLYLAMRLALAAVYANQAVPLPLVADDILVNFDDRRAASAATLLGDFAAEGHQVLAFTCHSHLAEVFTAQVPGAKLILPPKPV